MLQGDVDLRIPMDKGIVGAVATTGDCVNIPDAYEDPRFNQAVDMSTGYRTRTILCMPLKGADGNVIAVIQLINKATGVFTEEDEEMMNSFLTIAAPILETSQLFQSRGNKDESGSEFEGRTVKRTSSSKSAGLGSSMIIEEGDEDEDDDDDDE